MKLLKYINFHGTTQSYSDLKQTQIKVNTRLNVVLWASLQSPILAVFCLDQTDLLVAEVEGLLAPVSTQLQDGNEVPDGSEDGEAQDRVNVDPWVLPCAIWEALILQHTGYLRSLSPGHGRSVRLTSSTETEDELEKSGAQLFCEAVFTSTVHMSSSMFISCVCHVLMSLDFTVKQTLTFFTFLKLQCDNPTHFV